MHARTHDTRTQTHAHTSTQTRAHAHACTHARARGWGGGHRQAFLSDNTVFNLTGDLVSMKAQLEALEPGAYPSFLSYMREAAVNYARGFSSRPFNSMDNSIWVSTPTPDP